MGGDRDEWEGRRDGMSGRGWRRVRGKDCKMIRVTAEG